MNKKNIILFGLVILAIIIGYILRTENFDVSGCSWTDLSGNVYNSNINSKCLVCYKCEGEDKQIKIKSRCHPLNEKIIGIDNVYSDRG